VRVRSHWDHQMRRDQRIFAILRNEKYYTKARGWTDDLNNAAIWPEKQARSKVKIDIGMPCEIVEVFPMVRDDSHREIVE